MAMAAHHLVLLACVREGNEERARAALGKMPAGWVRQNAEDLLQLAQSYSQFSMMPMLRAARDADATGN